MLWDLCKTPVQALSSSMILWYPWCPLSTPQYTSKIFMLKGSNIQSISKPTLDLELHAMFRKCHQFFRGRNTVCTGFWLPNYKLFPNLKTISSDQVTTRQSWKWKWQMENVNSACVTCEKMVTLALCSRLQTALNQVQGWCQMSKFYAFLLSPMVGLPVFSKSPFSTSSVDHYKIPKSFITLAKVPFSQNFPGLREGTSVFTKFSPKKT